MGKKLKVADVLKAKKFLDESYAVACLCPKCNKPTKLMSWVFSMFYCKECRLYFRYEL